MTILDELIILIGGLDEGAGNCQDVRAIKRMAHNLCQDPRNPGADQMIYDVRRIERAAYGLWVATGHRASDWAYIAPEAPRKRKYVSFAKAALEAADEVEA